MAAARVAASTVARVAVASHPRATAQSVPPRVQNPRTAATRPAAEGHPEDLPIASQPAMRRRHWSLTLVNLKLNSASMQCRTSNAAGIACASHAAALKKKESNERDSNPEQARSKSLI